MAATNLHLRLFAGQQRRLLIIPGLIWISICFSFDLFAQQEPRPDTINLPEVKIFGKAIFPYPVQMITCKPLENDLIRDIGEMLRMQSNISGIRKGGIAIDPVVRGFRYDQVKVILNDGINIEGGCPNRMDPVASHIEVDDIRQIEVIKGPFVLKYGPVMGALINIRTAQPQSQSIWRLQGSGIYGYESNWNGHKGHVEFAGGNQAFFFRVSGGLKHYGNYKAGNGDLINSSFTKQYASVNMGLALHKKHHVAGFYTFNKGLDVRFPALPMDEKEDLTQVISIRYQYLDLSKRIKMINLMGYYVPVSHTMDNLYRPTAETMQASTTIEAANGGSKISTVAMFGKHKITSGADFEYIFKDGKKSMWMEMVMGGDTFSSHTLVNVFQEARWCNTGAFLEYQAPYKNVELSTAIRIDFNQASSNDTFSLIKNGIGYFDDLGSFFINLSGAIGLKIRITHNLSFLTSLGLGTRSPSILERFIKRMPVQFDAYDYLGNPQLKPEKNYQADLALEYIFPEFGKFTCGGFFSIINNYIIGKLLPPSVITPSTQNALGVKQYTNINQVSLTGFEVRFTTSPAYRWGIDLSVAATYGTNPRATRYITEQGQVIGEENILNDPLPEIPPLEGSVDFHYTFLQGKVIPKVSFLATARQSRVSRAFNETATPGFIVVNTSVAYNPCPYLSMAVNINNIFNHSYYEHLNRRVIGDARPLYEPGRILFLSLGFHF